MNNPLWSKYFQEYPFSTIQDFIKYLYQSTLGSAHFITDPSENFEAFINEYHSIDHDDQHVLYEPLNEDFGRIHLEALNEQHLKIIHQWILKSVSVTSSKDSLIQCFNKVEKDILEGWIPFSLESWQTEIKNYQQNGCPAVSHSQIFKQHYHPHYRIIKKEYIPLMHIMQQIDELPPYSIIAIEGQSGSGKSSLANMLHEIYNYPIIHMDDFFLQKHQRTLERLNEVGGNIDYERFYQEVITPINQHQSFDYSIFDCQSMSIQGQRHIHFDSQIIVEGSYSLHPFFQDYASFSIFLSLPFELQKQRIKKRNGDKMLERFIHEWIPKENQYFQYFDIEKKADMIIKNDSL